jgi:hypothetical protein
MTTIKSQYEHEELGRKFDSGNDWHSGWLVLNLLSPLPSKNPNNKKFWEEQMVCFNLIRHGPRKKNEKLEGIHRYTEHAVA